VTLGILLLALRLAGRRRRAADAHDDRARLRRRDALPGDAGRADLNLGDELRTDVRARDWLDYALFRRTPHPRRAVRHKLHPVDATAVTMDTAGKAVVFSGVTVLVSLSAEMFGPLAGVSLE